MTSEGHRRAHITVLDLFAGCGGLTEGFHQYRPEGSAGPVFQSVGAVEWEPTAAASYAANFGAGSSRLGGLEAPEIVCRTIVGWEPHWEPGDIDVVVGGPPCQGFSGLNREKVRPERNTLWEEFIRIVVALQPKVFVIENVDRFLRSAEFSDLKFRIGGANLRNYRLVDPGSKPGETESERDKRYLLNAANYGAAQARRRAIVIGVRTDAGLPTDLMSYPKPTHSGDTLRRAARLKGAAPSPGAGGEETAWATIDELFRESASKEIAADLPAVEARQVPGIEGRFAGPFLTTDLHIGRKPEPISLSRYRAIPKGGNRKDLRGRYACRFDDGDELILQTVNEHRRDDGTLNVPGAHFVVVNGASTERRVTVHSVSSFEQPPAAGSRRSKSELFHAVVTDGDVDRNAVLEYLSTEAWDSHDAGSGDVMGRLRSGAPSVTIRTEFFKPEKGRYLHPIEDRPITHFEAARLQGFPDDFKWYGSKLEIAKQIGNAVPIPLGRKIAESIYTYLRQAE
ncbi:DNA cytosine methyltransferase [Agromyces sp. H3Y2-19a]|uniref:DNA cytosine methyltransferase n=1 Tax=Agromyces chromiiresistens TaxID=3030835 RepID=UPI0023B8AAE8|nr:DNA cytosine methyltransferase [Agromyces chromiiresistens]MDF0512394.1 DNA cytosine methyltransferase [Agromyces chromiiresistens]